MLRMSTDDELVTVSQAARECDVSIATIHRRIRTGDLVPVMQLPGPTGAYLLRRGDILELLAS